MTFVDAAVGLRRRVAIVAVLAAATLAGSAAVAVEDTSAHGLCWLTVRSPYLSPSGAQIRGWSTYNCDFKHEVVKTCVAVERREGGTWETFGEAPHRCNPNATAFIARAQKGRPCVTGTYRTYGDGHAVGANGHRHNADRILEPPGGVFVNCSPTALLNTTLDDVMFDTADGLSVGGATSAVLP